LKTFQGIAPIAVLVLRDAVQHIRTRLLKRDKVAPPDGVLSALQEAELRHARNVSEKLSLPCQIFLPAELPSAKHFAETQLTRL
jgi:hypothetical protein